MKKIFHKTITLMFCLLSLQGLAFAQSIVGLWDTIDDKTGEQKAVVELTEKDGKIEGKIVSVFWKKGDHQICVKCSGELKDKPIVGLRFIWDMQQISKNIYEGGSILDPHNGMVYHAKFKLHQQKLFVRAYLGVPLLGRTQEWHRHHEAKQ
jgi:uncharacterized protein (DUF2147 family)